VQRELLARGALAALITHCGCLGPCFDGPNAVVYPDGVWYAGLEPDDAAGLADHLASGRVLTAKVSYRPGTEPESDPAPAGGEAAGDRDHTERNPEGDAPGDRDRDAGRR
jgi:(2Fe-2S) ferredoxin